MMLAELVLLTSLVGSALFFSAVHGKTTLAEACASWNSWKTSLENDPDFRLTCDVDARCTGIRCGGRYQDLKFDLELLVHHCADPVAVEVRLSAPRLNVRGWNRTFDRGETLQLPSGTLEVFLRRKDEETLVFGCSLLERSGDGKAAIVLKLRNRPIKLPPCDKAVSRWQRQSGGYLNLLQNAKPVQGGKPCDLGALRGCGANQMCEEVRRSDPPQGTCICLPNFHWYNNEDRVCVPIVPSPSPGDAATNGTGSQPPSNSSALTTAVQIVVPLLFVTLLTVLAFLAHRLRWVPKLRARLRRPSSRIYEEMVIDGDEDGGVRSLTSDPVA